MDKKIINTRVIIIIWAALAMLYRYITIMRLLIIKGATYRVCFLSRLDRESDRMRSDHWKKKDHDKNRRLQRYLS